jgi:hypothetical protein
MSHLSPDLERNAPRSDVAVPRRTSRLNPRSVIIGVLFISIIGLAIWYLATGDFDLRTFAMRAYPVEKIDGLRPGMSVYADWHRRSR